MEPPRGLFATVWNFICFLPYFIGLLLLGCIKGILLWPFTCLIMTVGNIIVIVGLWPLHWIYSFYSVLCSKQLGPVLKLVLCLCIPAILVLWLTLGVVGSIVAGTLYGLLSPLFATFKAVGEGKTDQFYHCIYDGTWDTIKGSFIVVRDLRDVCYHSFLSIMDDLRCQGPPEKNYYEIRILYLPGALFAAMIGFAVDFPMIAVVSACKSPYMLLRGWQRLFQDCIGREGPFLETICVPFAGLAILLWPAVVMGAVLLSMVASIFMGFYAGVIVYQESSFLMGMYYILATLSIYDEWSNDMLDMPEGSCFPRPEYRKRNASEISSRTASFSRPDSFRNPPARTTSLATPLLELKPLEFADGLFKECQCYGEIMVSEGIITIKDIEDAKSNKDSEKVISSGLPAYCLLQVLVRSAKANSAGLLLNNNSMEITSSNRPKDTFFDWFLNPLLIMKDQIKAENLSEAEEVYLGKLVLLSGDPARLKNTDIGSPPESELRRAELDALARRLRGITKSISRYPTFRRRFESSMKVILEELAKKNDNGELTNAGYHALPRSRSAFVRIFSQKSFKGKASNAGDQEAQPVIHRDVEIE